MDNLYGGPSSVEACKDTYLWIKATGVVLLDMVSEPGLAAIQVTRHPLIEKVGAGEMAVHRLGLLIHGLPDPASILRLLPIGTAFQRMQRLVRNLSHRTYRPLELIPEGGKTQIDRNLVDQLHDLLILPVCSAVDQDIASPEEHTASSRSRKWRIVLTAIRQGREVHITVADDRRGLDRQALSDRVWVPGVVGADEELKDFVIAPGYPAGSVVALIRILTIPPLISPGVVIVQHMLVCFTTSFTWRLNSGGAGKRAQDGDRGRPAASVIRTRLSAGPPKDKCPWRKSRHT